MSKRQASEHEWIVRIGQPSTARMMIDMVYAVLPTCTFQVQKSSDFEGIVVQNMDEKKCCIVHAKLQCDVEMPTSVEHFTLSLKDMSVCMRSVAGHYILELRKVRSSEEVQIISRDAVTDTKINACTIRTQYEDFEKAEMRKGIDYDFTVKIDLTVFRSIVKTAKDLGSGSDEKLEFRVYKRVGAENTILFCLRSEGTSSTTEHYFPSTCDGDEDGAYSASTASAAEDVDGLDDPTKWVKAYNDVFSLNYLGHFIRSMDRQQVTLRISPDKPLLVLFNLGGDASEVCYILASKVDD